jgi:hypothetical protein
MSRRGGSPSSARWPFLHHHGERRAGFGSSTKVAICFFSTGVSSHLRQAGPSHLLHHLFGPSSSVTSSCSSKLPLLERCPLSLSHHSSPSSSTARGAVCHGTLTVARSSSSWRTFRSVRSCQSTRWLRSQATKVVLGDGKEYTAVKEMRPHCSHCLRQSRRSHCSYRQVGPTAPTMRRSRRYHCPTASTSTGVGEQGSIWAQRAQIWAPIFLFLKNDFE